MSPAITRAPNYTAALWTRPRRICGSTWTPGPTKAASATGGGDYWYKPWEAYAIFLRQGYAVNRDLLMRIGCGAGHNEAAWSARFPEAVRFLLDVRREANPSGAGGVPAPAWNGLDGRRRSRWRSPGAGWLPLCPGTDGRPDGRRAIGRLIRFSSAETNLWGSLTWSGDLPAGFYRLRALPGP